jgi:hypothetical protein
VQGEAQVTAQAITSGISVENTVVDLVQIPHDTLANVNGVLKIKVLPQVRAHAVERIKVSIQYKDGRKEEKMIEIQFNGDIKTEISELSYARKPVLGSKQDLSFTLKNISGWTSDSKLKVVLSSEDNKVNIIDGEVTIDPLMSAKSIRVEGLVYSMSGFSGLGRTREMYLEVYDGEKLVGEATVYLGKE